MPYIKSHSNYVLKSKHQDIKDGTILERDITTVGGIGEFPDGQTPIYRSGNFLITVRDDNKPTNQYNTSKWKENTSGEIWTLDTLDGMISDFENDDDTKIVLKQDYYDLRDFAYYGSLTELFRASVTDIVNRFPGELYLTKNDVYYTSSFTEDFETVKTQVKLGGINLKQVDNPFGIDLHTIKKPSDGDELKYFADGGYKNYEIYDGYRDFQGVVNGWSSTYYYFERNNDGTFTNYSASTTSKTVNSSVSNIPYPCDGEKMADISIHFGNAEMAIEAWINGDSIVYLYDNSNEYEEYHIRPKQEFLGKFYNECDNFERLLMNKDTNYKALFSVIRENDYGYYREFVPLQFPLGLGGYNIDTDEYGFNDYTSKMVEIGEYYDEKFTDNLWRSMTHESIKNFDWTQTHQTLDNESEDYAFGTERIQKVIRIFGRQFDETLSYINNIKNCNRVSYDERSNLPDYFLTDTVSNDGWNVKLIYPYTLDENTVSSIHKKYSQNSNDYIKPYTKNIINDDSENGYFITCCDDGDFIFDCKYLGTPYNLLVAENNQISYFDECAFDGKGATKDRIKTYTDESEWSFQECNNEFLRRLKINSKQILRNKGTVEGVEMILGMFGLKSKRWTDAINLKKCQSESPDFNVTEYVSFTPRIEETWDVEHQEYRINWINSTKQITYDNRFVTTYNPYGTDTIVPYQGLPIAYRDEYVNDNILEMWVDNYGYLNSLSESEFNNEIDYPCSFGANHYIYNGEMLEYDGQTCYMWRAVGDCGEALGSYLLTNTTNLGYLQHNSISNNAYDIDTDFDAFVMGLFDGTTYIQNAQDPIKLINVQLLNTDSPYINGYKRQDGSSVLKRYLYPNFNDNEQFDGNPYFQMNGGWQSKKIVGNRELSMWVDDSDYLSDLSQSDLIDEVDNPCSFGAAHYIYKGEMFEYDGQTCYMWRAVGDCGELLGSYLLTNTTNFGHLQHNSISNNAYDIDTDFDAFVMSLVDGNVYLPEMPNQIKLLDVEKLDKQLKFSFQFDSDDNFVTSTKELYKETVRNIRTTENVSELLSIPTSELYNGIICHVNKVEDNSAVIDGEVYPITQEWNNGSVSEYISLIKTNDYIKVGKNRFFDSSIAVYNYDGVVVEYNLEDKSDGFEVKAYIRNGNYFICRESVDNDYYSISSFVRLYSDESGYSNYFLLNDVVFADEMGNYQSMSSVNGWRRLLLTSQEYLKVNTIVNDYDGNNPHNGNMVYDNGHEYFKYFKQIFKYPLENELFDSRCYSDVYKTMDEEISKYGFVDLINSDDSVLTYDDFIYKDTKIHYFGNYKSGKNVYIYGDNIKRTLGYNTIYTNNAIISYNLGSNKGWLEGENPYYNIKTKMGYNDVDEVTNQIVNNKRLLITFYLNYAWDSKSGLEEIKYLDDIVMNYLTQMIPSTTILEIEYKSKI